MIINIKNTDAESPVIFRLMRREEGAEIDCKSEMQLLPGQDVDIEVSAVQSVTVFQR